MNVLQSYDHRTRNTLKKKKNPIMKNIYSICLLAVTLLGSIDAEAYFIRPFVQDGGSSIDGYIENGATSGSQNFTSTHVSEVDLDDGTVKAFLSVTGTNQFGQTAGVFGDTVTFNDATGTNVDFSFAFDGSINISDVINAGSPLQVGVNANLFVFEAGSGADYTNFAGFAGALIGESILLDFSDPTEDLLAIINEELSGTLIIDAVDSFDVFASLSIFTVTNSNPVTVNMDFLNTGTFGIDTAPGVTYSSESGVFLDSVSGVVVPPQATVPEPATLALLGLGLAGLGFRKKLKA